MPHATREPDVIAEEYTPGLVDWLEQNASASSDADTSALIEQYASVYGLRGADARGLDAGDALAKLLDRVRGRELVADEGVRKTNFRWLAFHVPPGGQGSIAWKRTTSESGRLTLKVFGVGLGGSATLQLSSGVELSECRTCQEIMQWLEVRVRRYRRRLATGDFVQETTVDPVRWLHQEPRDLASDECGGHLADLDAFRFESLDGEAVDARSSNAHQRKVRELSVELATSASLKLDAMGVEAGVELASSGTLGCTMTWEFTPGRLYVPFVERGRGSRPPRWSIG